MLSNYIVKIMKSLYDISKLSNHWFVIYNIYNKDKLEIKESIYNFYFFYNFSLFDIIQMQIDDI